MTLSAEGFSTEAQYTASPRVEVPGKTTRGFIPGPIQPGKWAAELGVGAVIAQSEGDADGKVAWRVEIDLSDDPSYADEPYQPAPYDSSPVRAKGGWFAGDMHVHAEHSNYGAATMTDTFDYAFKPLAQGGAGLDFITLSDYVSGYPAWNEIGRYQSAYPNNLVIRSDEVITYKGHTNNHASAKFVDYRTTPVYERVADKSLKLLSGGRDPRDIFREVHEAGGWTQINHPQIFPPTTPAVGGGLPRLLLGVHGRPDRLRAGGCLRDRHRRPGTSAATRTRSRRWRSRSTSACWGSGYKIAAVGSSDSHDAGRGERRARRPRRRRPRPWCAPASCRRRASAAACRRHHTYVKVTGNAGPDLRFSGRPWGNRQGQGDRRRHDPRLGREVPRPRDRRRGRHPPGGQERRDGGHRPDHGRRLRARVPRGRQRPLAPSDHERRG